jgi:hypothetical protein
MKGGQYVTYRQIQHPRVARAPDIAANLARAVGRRRDANSVVIHLGKLVLSAQASSSYALVKRLLASLAYELNVRAMAALDAACKIPSRVQRVKAMNKAMILRNAVEIHEHFFGKGDAPAR